MKELFLTLIMVSIAFCDSFATEIKQYPYAKDQDVVKEVKQNTFVICKKCPDIQDLSASRALPKIAIMAHSETLPLSRPEMMPLSSSKKDYKEKTVIYFKFDSARLMDSEKEKLEQASKTISQGVDHIKATGYTCKIGGKKYNEILARRRAKSVASFLENKGIKVSEVIGKGKCCYASNENKLNRRVELEVKNK